jgi:hypothetical protein
MRRRRGLEAGVATMRHRSLQILWPAFVMAGFLEAMLFAVVDPGDLRWFGGPLIGWPALAIYTVTFVIFWGVIASACALTVLLAMSEKEINRLDVAAGHVVAPKRRRTSKPR